MEWASREIKAFPQVDLKALRVLKKFCLAERISKLAEQVRAYCDFKRRIARGRAFHILAQKQRAGFTLLAILATFGLSPRPLATRVQFAPYFRPGGGAEAGPLAREPNCGPHRLGPVCSVGQSRKASWRLGQLLLAARRRTVKRIEAHSGGTELASWPSWAELRNRLTERQATKLKV